MIRVCRLAVIKLKEKVKLIFFNLRDHFLLNTNLHGRQKFLLQWNDPGCWLIHASRRLMLQTEQLLVQGSNLFTGSSMLVTGWFVSPMP